MAKIIFTSRYFKNPKRSNIGKLVKYMGTREGVEKLPNGIDNNPATRKQQNLVQSIIKKYPESQKYIEYADYKIEPTKSNATEFIDTFIERNADRAEELKHWYHTLPNDQALKSSASTDCFHRMMTKSIWIKWLMKYQIIKELYGLM